VVRTSVSETLFNVDVKHIFLFIYPFLPSASVEKRKIRIYKTIILPLRLYGYKIWSLTLREEHRLKMFENRALRRIFGPKRDEVTGGWRKLHNEELREIYSSPRWVRHAARREEKRNAYRILVGKLKGKIPPGRRRWVDNIKMDLGEMGWCGLDWIGLAQDRNMWRALVNSVLNLRVP
jgi:hypothetical protein